MSLILHLSFEEAGAESPPPGSDAYARMLTALLPPGRLWRVIAGTVLSKLLAGCADELARLEARAYALLEERDPRTATELLPEYERELDLDEAPTIEERRARVVARTVARQRYRPVDFQTALAPLLGQDAEDVVVLERTHAIAVSMGDDREIFRFFIYRDPAAPGTYFLESAQALVGDLATQRGGIKPTHTAGYVIESIDFLCDDPFSLCDRDLLGA